MSDGSAGTVVLVHGGFVDGSGWQGVYQQLTKDGHAVSVVQNPTVSHADDVAVTKRVIEAVSEPVILVGHSYGGAVITEAGNHPKVSALVYIAAFVPDKGESVNTVIAGLPDRWSAAADSGAAGWVSLARPGQVPRFIRG
jgi:pimeloyl-ACP methyl ester carboxylesterase